MALMNGTALTVLLMHRGLTARVKWYANVIHIGLVPIVTSTSGFVTTSVILITLATDQIQTIALCAILTRSRIQWMSVNVNPSGLVLAAIRMLVSVTVCVWMEFVLDLGPSTVVHVFPILIATRWVAVFVQKTTQVQIVLYTVEFVMTSATNATDPAPNTV